jgi:hypothetical protein
MPEPRVLHRDYIRFKPKPFVINFDIVSCRPIPSNVNLQKERPVCSPLLSKVTEVIT